ncbi:hypothetical protein BGX26_007579 [Mortierella sp. AD094]|nr:hypothetical protein BGX26_007579 [Mortierella sp. AD094]
MDLAPLSQHPVRSYILASSVLTTLMSIGLAAVGVSGLSNISLNFLGFDSLSWILITLSMLILVVSVIGCTSTLMESKRLIFTYGVMVSILVISQFSLVIYTLAQQGKLASILDQAWQDSYDFRPRKLRDIETRLSCCGFSSVEDRAIPKTSPDACRRSPAFGYQISCQDQLVGSYAMNESAMLTCVACIQILQLLSLASAVVLWLQIPLDEVIEGQYSVEHSARLLRGLREEDLGQRQQPNASSSQVQEQAGYGSISNQN